MSGLIAEWSIPAEPCVLRSLWQTWGHPQGRQIRILNLGVVFQSRRGKVLVSVLGRAGGGEGRRQRRLDEWLSDVCDWMCQVRKGVAEDLGFWLEHLAVPFFRDRNMVVLCLRCISHTVKFVLKPTLRPVGGTVSVLYQVTGRQ